MLATRFPTCGDIHCVPCKHEIPRRAADSDSACRAVTWAATRRTQESRLYVCQYCSRRACAVYARTHACFQSFGLALDWESLSRENGPSVRITDPLEG